MLRFTAAELERVRLAQESEARWERMATWARKRFLNGLPAAKLPRKSLAKVIAKSKRQAKKRGRR